MADAVIVATARSPIGRAFKGSLEDLRPDDLAATIVAAALAKVPELDPRDVDDLMLGCGLPGGEQGSTWPAWWRCSWATTTSRHHADPVLRVVPADHPDGHPRHQGRRRRRVRLRRSGDGQPVRQGQQRLAARHQEPAVRRGRGAAPAARRGRRRLARPAPDGLLPDAYIAMGQTAENVAQLAGISRAEQDEFAVRSQNLAEQAHRARLLRARDHAGHPSRRHPVSARTTAPAPGVTSRRVAAAQAGLPPRRVGHRRQLLPAQRRRGRGRGDERHQGARARDHPAGAHRGHRGERRCRRRSWAWARSRRPGRRCGGPA